MIFIVLGQNCLFSRPLQGSNLRQLRCFLFVCLGLVKDDVSMIFGGILSHMGSLGQLKTREVHANYVRKDWATVFFEQFCANQFNLELFWKAQRVSSHTGLLLQWKHTWKKQHPLRFFCFSGQKRWFFFQEGLGIPAVNCCFAAPDHGADAGIAYFASWLVIWTGNFFFSAVMRYESRAVMRLKGKLNTVHTQIQESAAVGW